jgi:hypothetical protein
MEDRETCKHKKILRIFVRHRFQAPQLKPARLRGNQQRQAGPKKHRPVVLLSVFSNFRHFLTFA